MKYRRTINQKLIFVLLALFLLNVFGWLINHAVVVHDRNANVKKIDSEIHKMGYAQNMIEHDLEILDGLLSLRHLTTAQLGELYMLKSTLYYTNNDMTSFFETVGNALFYEEKAENTDDMVYLYANMAKYFHEVGDTAEAKAMIDKAYSIRPFYECQNVFTKLQALQVYSRIAVEKGDFETALRAADQIIADSESEFINSFNQNLSVYYRRSGEVVKVLVTLFRNDFKKAYEDSKALRQKYYSQDEIVSQFNAFDFYLPLLYVQSVSACQLGHYGESLDYLKQYSDFCDQYFFTKLKLSLSKKIMLLLPHAMEKERTALFVSISDVAEKFEQDMLEGFTRMTRDKFLTMIDSLSEKTDMRESRLRSIKQAYLNLTVLLFLLLVIVSLYYQLQLDGLTRLNNRASLNARVRRFSLMNKKYAAIMVDIDNFKRLNDTYGHAFGDYVLKYVAGVLASAEGRGITAYRYGGEEFVIIIEQNDLEKAIRVSENLRSTICRNVLDKGVRVTASFGIGMVPDNPIEQADKNMYKAKESGKNFTAYEKDGKDFLAERRLEIRNPVPKPAPEPEE